MKKKPSRKKRKEQNAEEQKNLIRPVEEVVSKRYGAFRYFEHEHGASISFDLEDWHKPTFINVLNKIPGLSIIENKQIHKSIAPALVYEDFITTLGTLHVDREMDDFPGCTVASDNEQLMTLVVEHLVAIGYEMRPIKVAPTNTATEAPKESINSEPLSVYPFSYYEHDHGATISFELDSFNPDDLFNELKKMSGFEIVKKESLYSSFGPLESASEYYTTKGNFTLANTWEGMNTGHTISSSNKDLIKLFVDRLRESSNFSEITASREDNTVVEPLEHSTPKEKVSVIEETKTDDQPNRQSTTPKESKSDTGCGGILLTVIFLCLTFYLITLALNFYSKLSINLDDAKVHRGKVIHSSISTKGGVRKSTGFNLELEGLSHRFRFFKGNFSALKERIRPGVIITVYYEAYSWDIYQIEENGEVLYGKEILEAGQWPGVIMSLIFAFFTGWITWFFIRRI